jgi:hypothetical protein
MMTPLLSKPIELMEDRTGFRVVSSMVLHPRQASASHPREGQPEGALEYLRPGNSRLIDLNQRYARFDPRAIFARHCYHPIAREPRYADPIVQKYGIDPVWLNLFEQR